MVIQIEILVWIHSAVVNTFFFALCVTVTMKLPSLYPHSHAMERDLLYILYFVLKAAQYVYKNGKTLFKWVQE